MQNYDGNWNHKISKLVLIKMLQNAKPLQKTVCEFTDNFKAQGLCWALSLIE